MDQAIKLGVAVSATEFGRVTEKMSALFKSGDVLERVPQELLGRFKDALFSGGTDEICELVVVTATGTRDVLFEVKPAGVAKEMIAALRALGFDVD